MAKKLFMTALLLVALAVSARSSRADSFMTYELTGHGYDITFTLPQTFTPDAVDYRGTVIYYNVPGFDWGGAPATARFSAAGYNGYTDYWAAGSSTHFFELNAPGLFTWNADGTVTLNTGTWFLSDNYIGPYDYTLTAVDPPGPNNPTGVPEPASALLLGIGGLATAAIRRRKRT